MSFQAASSAVEAKWVAEAVSEGDWGNVSSIVPSGFEAYVSVRHPAWLHHCTKGNLADLNAGREIGRAVRWAEVAQSDMPVLYGYTLHTRGGTTRARYTQYRRLQDGRWLLDELPDATCPPALRPGDTWISGPKEGTLEPDPARVLQGVLARETAGAEPCWFGIWEGFGSLTDAQRAAPSIEAPNRRWHLFRAPLDHLERPFWDCDGVERLTANLAWPEDRSWCLATEIDAEVTYVGGSRDLIAAILEEPGLEAVSACLDERLACLGDVLTPVVDRPAGASVRPGFESREYAPDCYRPGFGQRLGVAMGRLYRWSRGWGASLGKDHDGTFRSRGLVLKRDGKRRNKRR